MNKINDIIASPSNNATQPDDSSNGTSYILPSFPNRIPDNRLGTKHESLDSFHKSAFGIASENEKNTKEYTLIVVIETTKQSSIGRRKQQRILLGLKNRGFGMGKYNSFGGKFLHNEEEGAKETAEECACRELEEETNLRISLEEMKVSKVGIQKFTFDDNDKQMIVHLFFIDLANMDEAYEIKECEEITPKWFDSFDDLPLSNMFADDSLWLTTLLTKAMINAQEAEEKPIMTKLQRPPLEINGSYHFAENCEETNTILHYYMDVKVPSPVINAYLSDVSTCV